MIFSHWRTGILFYLILRQCYFVFLQRAAFWWNTRISNDTANGRCCDALVLPRVKIYARCSNFRNSRLNNRIVCAPNGHVSHKKCYRNIAFTVIFSDVARQRKGKEEKKFLMAFRLLKHARRDMVEKWIICPLWGAVNIYVYIHHHIYTYLHICIYRTSAFAPWSSILEQA